MFIISSRNRPILQSNTEITYHDSIIMSCSTAKILGVTDNNSLSWNDHIETVIKCITYLYILSRIKLYLSTDNCKRFYNAYFLSHFDLCCVVMWRKCTSSTMFSDIKWLSFYQTGYIYESYSNVFKLSGELRLNTLGRRLRLRLIYMQDCYVHHLISSYILQNLI